MSETKTYTIKVKYEQNDASDVHYTTFKAKVKANLTANLPASQGTAEAQIVSVSES